MVILAIDPGTKLGWALGRDGRLLESGTEDLSPRRGESSGSRFLRFRAWLERAGQGVDVVVYEQPPQLKSSAALEILFGITTRITEWSEERGIPCVNYHPATIKKRVAGRGNAKKPEMKAQAYLLWNRALTLTDDNEADALCLLWLAFRDYGSSELGAGGGER